MNKKERYYLIEVLYALGTLLVIMGHSHPNEWKLFEHTLYNEFIGIIYTFHMHLFFFTAGFLFINSKSLEEKGLVKWAYVINGYSSSNFIRCYI